MDTNISDVPIFLGRPVWIGFSMQPNLEPPNVFGSGRFTIAHPTKSFGTTRFLFFGLECELEIEEIP